MKIFIGYESEYPEAYAVCKESILRFNDKHEIIPLVKDDLEKQGIYTRKFQGESTEFAFTRFLVPYLCDYKGFALFCDGDFLWRQDPDTLLEYRDYSCVQVVKHPVFGIEQYVKMHDKINKPYPKKYWSSLMYFDNSRCTKLTPEVVNTASAGYLHGMEWATHIGDIPAIYNALINYYDFGTRARAVHFTDGGPWQGIESHVLYSYEWKKLYDNLLKAKILS